MIFYHGTTEEAWKLIQTEGVLWGRHGPNGNSETYRYTYLTPNKETAIGFSEGVLLEVDYTPKEYDDNYPWDGWQFSVFDPIPLLRIKKSSCERKYVLSKKGEVK